MILTSNRGFAEWGEIFGDQVVATVRHGLTAETVIGAPQMLSLNSNKPVSMVMARRRFDALKETAKFLEDHLLTN
jgi:hypothetical protein